MTGLYAPSTVCTFCSDCPHPPEYTLYAVYTMYRLYTPSSGHCVHNVRLYSPSSVHYVQIVFTLQHTLYIHYCKDCMYPHSTTKNTVYGLYVPPRTHYANYLHIVHTFQISPCTLHMNCMNPHEYTVYNISRLRPPTRIQLLNNERIAQTLKKCIVCTDCIHYSEYGVYTVVRTLQNTICADFMEFTQLPEYTVYG